MRKTGMITALALLASGCGGGDDTSVATPTATTPATAAPTPPTTPVTSTPIAPEAAAPATPVAPSYMTFADIYITRLGAGITLPSACSGFIQQGQPPAVLPVSAYGRGLSFRFVLTPQVWAIGGDYSIGFDGRDGDPSIAGAEVQLAKVVAGETVRFSINRPSAGGTGLDYARQASLSAPVQGAPRLYQCALGVTTLPADLPTAPAGAFRKAGLSATAYVREGGAARAYSLGRSVATVSADMTARRITIALRLIATPMGAGPDVELGSLTASGAIDPATGNFTAPLASADRIVAGSISGRFFGPQAVEIGAAIGATVADAPGAPGFAIAGGLYAIR
jgi:hypothetical protein